MFPPVLSSLTELLTGTFTTEDFKKLIQPASLVAAAIFLTLNLLLVLPLLVAQGVAPFVSLQRMATVWQVLIGTLVLIVLGYLINSLGASFVSVLDGDAFRDSPIVYKWLRNRQQRKFQELSDVVKNGGDEPKKAAAAHKLATEHPHQEELVAPTRLGNVLLNPADYAWAQHGAHLNTIWPIMSLALKEKDAELHDKITDSSNRFTFLATVSVLLLIVATELALVGLIFQRPLYGLLGAPVIAILAYLVYLAAVKEAKAWGREVRTALDIHLDVVADRLALRPLPQASFAKKRERWQAVSKWLAYGGTRQFEGYTKPAPEKEWYVAPPDPVFEVVGSPIVEVVKKRLTRRGAIPDLDHPDTKWVFGAVADYTILITNSETGKTPHVAQGAYLLVTDSKLTRQQAVRGTLLPAGATIDAEWRAGDPPTLFWALGDIPHRSTYALHYTVRYEDELEVELEPVDAQSSGVRIVSLTQTKSPEQLDNFELKAENGTQAPTVKVRVTLHSAGGSLSDWAGIGDDDLQAVWLSADERQAEWDATVPQATPLVFSFTRLKSSSG